MNCVPALLVLITVTTVCATSYCPSSSDFVTAYGNPQIFDQGWKNTGGGGVATKAAYNLLGGSVEYDIDFTDVRTGVNANIYTVSPNFSPSGYVHSQNYCDGQGSGDHFCTEVDWIETNGNCGAQTTLHTRTGTGNNGCTQWGCQANYKYNGRTKFHMKITYDTEGRWTTTRDGITISPNGGLSPQPQDYDWSFLKQQYQSRGAVIVSTQWEGWVPLAECGTSGDLGASTFSVSNLRIEGTVVNGPEPRQCSGGSPSAPSGTGNGNSGNSGDNDNRGGNTGGGNTGNGGGNCESVTLASDPNNHYWVEVNAPQNAHVYVVCTNGENKYLSCNFQGVKWVCPTNGQDCAPNWVSGRFAVVNNEWCKLDRNVPRATDASEFVEGNTIDEVSNDAVMAVADSDHDSGQFISENFDSVENTETFAAIEDTNSEADFFPENLDAATIDQATTVQTQTTSDKTPPFAVALIVVLSILAVALIVLIVVNAKRLTAA